MGSVAAAAYNLTFQLGFATTQICESVAVAVQTLLAYVTCWLDFSFSPCLLHSHPHFFYSRYLFATQERASRYHHSFAACAASASPAFDQYVDLPRRWRCCYPITNDICSTRFHSARIDYQCRRSRCLCQNFPGGACHTNSQGLGVPREWDSDGRVRLGIQHDSHVGR